jgi:hypothetical protein
MGDERSTPAPAAGAISWRGFHPDRVVERQARVRGPHSSRCGRSPARPRIPSGDVVEYTIDGRNRRVGRTVNGALNPVAELDGAGSVVARFV